MIHVELSVAPHYKNVIYTEGLHRAPDSEPPHVIVSKRFNTWVEAQQFLAPLELKPYGGLEGVFDNPTNEYVQVELELMDVTGKIFVAACLSIEGKEE